MNNKTTPTAKDTPGTDGAKHTPTPWAVNPTGDMWDGLVGTLEEPVAVCEGDNAVANAEFIVRAVNAHSVMLEVLKTLYRAIPDCEGDQIIGLHNPVKGIGKACRDARAAITLAERKQP